MNFHEGDRVAYSVGWLRSVMATTGELPFRRGTVVGEEQPIAPSAPNVVRVRWDDKPDDPKLVLVTNLAHPGLNTDFCSC